MASAVSVIGYIAVLIILISELSKNNISVSVFAAVFTSMDTMYGMANEIFGWIWKRAAGNMSFIKNFYLLMDIDEKNSSETNSGDIIFENVSFSYPESDNSCLKNISIKIKQGEKVAIVGENSAGKSTLAKLMLGIYKPDNGKVYLPYKRSAVFQDFNKYKFSLEDNIRISDTKDENNIDDICKELNININKNEILSKEFGGTDLSSGQWQKIAIGRGIYRENEMIILDEPTAAIDPIEEKNIYDEFLNIANSRTTVIITHRIGAARLADRIIVLESGQICEEGTHEELMNKNGKYCTMFLEQSKWYVAN